MESNLRPMSLGEILDRTAQLYRENFVLFAGIFAIYAGIALIFNLLLIGLGELLKHMHWAATQITYVTVAGGIVEMLILFLLAGSSIAAISRAVAWVHLGQQATIRGAYRSILPRMGRYIWLMTITVVVVYTPILLLYGGFFGSMAYYGLFKQGVLAAQPGAAPNPQQAFTVILIAGIFFLLLIPVGIYTVIMSLRYTLALPASVVEDLPARQSLRRSVLLSKGSRGRIFVLALLIGAIKLGLGMITQIFTLVTAVKNHGQLGPGISAVSQIIAFFTNSFLGPIYATGVTLFYYDMRVRKEGYDIEWMMEAAGLAGHALPPQLEATAEPVAHPVELPPALDPPGPESHEGAQAPEDPQAPGSVHE
jgi:hypothetical protein